MARKTVSDISAQATELIAIVEYAERLKVCPNTVRNWIAELILEEGKHYIRVGRVIRLFWDKDSLASIRDTVDHPPRPRPSLRSNEKNRRRLKLKA